MLVFFSFSNYVCVIAIFAVQSFPILVCNKYAPFDMLEIQTVTWSFIAREKQPITKINNKIVLFNFWIRDKTVFSTVTNFKKTERNKSKSRRPQKRTKKTFLIAEITCTTNKNRKHNYNPNLVDFFNTFFVCEFDMLPNKNFFPKIPWKDMKQTDMEPFFRLNIQKWNIQTLCHSVDSF